MEDFTDKELHELSDRLFSFFYPYFEAVQTIHSSHLGAIQYLSFVLYPDIKNQKKKRVDFYQAALWMLIKETHIFDKKEQKIISKNLGINFKESYRYKNAEKAIESARKRYNKAIQAWHTYELSTIQDIPIKTAIPKVSRAYKRSTYALENESKAEHTIQDINKRVIQPYRGIIHLAEGIVRSCLLKKEFNNRDILTLLTDTTWKVNAIEYSIESLKLRLLCNYINYKKNPTHTNLPLKDIIILKIQD
ncbi:hypothetical protein IMCC1989_1350 [gamma proteobacterium IMCC1989]|nr:hypothetical protein IMCC1989_1350 [gamma proteobacterium IMCC1989]